MKFKDVFKLQIICVELKGSGHEKIIFLQLSFIFAFHSLFVYGPEYIHMFVRYVLVLTKIDIWRI